MQARLTNSKASELERVRNNQRRCRARRKQHITDLETKLQQYEQADARTTETSRLHSMRQENDMLKRLLASLGLDHDFIRAYSQAASTAADVSSESKSRELQSRSPRKDINSYMSSATSPSGGMFMGPPQYSPNATEVETEWRGLQRTPFADSQDANDPLNDIHGFTQDQNMGSASDISGTSTLCSIAFAIVMQNNLKGYSPTNLDTKLRVGYKCGASSNEGCRVDNKVLFTVLAEIS